VRLLTIIHDEDSGAGIFGELLEAAGVAVQCWRPTAGEQPAAQPLAYDGVIAFGGSANPDQDERHPWLAAERAFLATALAQRVPLLGICLGAQLVAQAAGGEAQRMRRPEIGWHQVRLTEAGERDPLLAGADRVFSALEWHSYEVVLPETAVALARGESCVQAYRIGDVAWGMQFHAEVTADDFKQWLETYGANEEALAAGIDPRAVARETDQRIAGWHELGRGICSRFLRVAAG
jgi:GMP synthase (glutamine-hydrolysing)